MRYAALVALNLPIILLAFVNIITQYKMHKISFGRFVKQFVMWSVISLILIASFPIYNLLMGAPLLDSSKLSGFDIVQTTAIIYLIYVVNDHRRKIERSDRMIRELHQEFSIRLSDKDKSV